MKRISGFLFIFMLAALALSACARPGKLSIQDAWARPADAGGTSAVYFTLVNASDVPDLLTAARTDAAFAAELHETKPSVVDDASGDGGMDMGEGEVMQMVPRDSIAVPAGEQVEFAPGGLHVMLIDLQQDLTPGEIIDVTLVFEEAGEVPVQVEVRQP
jgi:copper(I)-binding protein